MVMIMNASEKVAYLKGLMEGLSPEESKAETKLIQAVIDTLETMAEDLHALEEQSKYFDGYLDELDSDLGDLEDEVYGLNEDEDDEDEEDDPDVFAPGCEDCEDGDCDDCCMCVDDEDDDDDEDDEEKDDED